MPWDSTDKYRDEDYAPRVEIDRLVDDGQVTNVTQDFYVQIYSLMHACAGDLAIPGDEIYERINRMMKHTQKPSIFVTIKVNRILRGLCIAEVGDTANTSHVGWLRMEVHPDYRSQKLGSMMLQAMKSWAAGEGIKRLEITSYARNKRGRDFFLRNGFHEEGFHVSARRDPATGEYLDTYTLAYLLPSEDE